MRRSGRLPESLHALDLVAAPELLERALADLAHPLARDAEQLADALERQRLGAMIEAVIEREDAALARREVALEEPPDEFALELRVGRLLDLARHRTGDPLTERDGAGVVALHRGVEGELGRGHAARGAHVLHRVV